MQHSPVARVGATILPARPAEELRPRASQNVLQGRPDKNSGTIVVRCSCLPVRFRRGVCHLKARCGSGRPRLKTESGNYSVSTNHEASQSVLLMLIVDGCCAVASFLILAQSDLVSAVE